MALQDSADKPDKDRVRVEYLWKQRLWTEQGAKRKADLDAIARHGRPSNFQMNFANQNRLVEGMPITFSHNRIEMVTEKEIKQSPQERSNLAEVDWTTMEGMAIKHLEKKPQQKFDLPVCAAQEVGWLLAHPVRSTSVEPPRRQAKRLARRLERLGMTTSGSTPAWSPKTSSMPTSASAMTRIRSAPHVIGNETHPDVGQLNNRRWRYPKNKCDVNQYAETYMHLMKHHPFDKEKAGR
jgi:hypothetical protein